MKKIIYYHCFSIILIIIFQSCSHKPLNTGSFFAVHAKNNVNQLIKNGTVTIDEDRPRQNISQSYENFNIIYQINPQKECIFGIQAFFTKLNTKAKILAWIKQNQVTIVNRKQFDTQQAFQIRGIHGLIFNCKRMPNGHLEVTRTYFTCL